MPNNDQDLSEEQKKQLELVRDIFRVRGRKLVLHGGAWTAEAREPKRRTAVLDQLELAHKLRSQLEDAADQAESELTTAEEIRKLILDQTEAMNRLASLTEAVKNGYVLHDYDEYNNNWDRAESEQKEEEGRQQLADEILLDHMDRMKFPNKQRPSRIPRQPPPHEEEIDPSQKDPSSTEDDESEKEEDSASWGDSVAKMPAADVSPGGTHYPIGLHQKPKSLNIRGHVLAIQQKMQIAKSRKKQRRKELSDTDGKKRKNRGEDSSSFENTGGGAGGGDHDFSRRYSEGSSYNSKKRIKLPMTSSRILPSVSANINDHRSKRKSLPSRLMEETGLVLRPPEAAVTTGPSLDNVKPDNPLSSSVPQQQQQQEQQQQERLPSVVPKNKKGGTSRKRKSEVQAPTPKKCHNCKTTQTKYLKCRFVMPTGMRCGKHYCLDCLNKDYDGQQNDPVDKEEWHCPACLGFCKCKPCCTQREKDKRREALIQEMQRNKPKRQRTGVSRLI